MAREASAKRRRRISPPTQEIGEACVDIPFRIRNATSRMPRPLSPDIDDALMEAALELLARDGFARMSVASVAAAAGVGKPAVYRRFRGKAELVAAAIATQLPEMRAPDL